MIYRPGAATLEVVAETITWKKGKSDKIGLKVPLTQPLLALLHAGVVYGFDRPANAWEEWTGSDAVLQRVEWANAAAQRLGAQSDPVSLAESALGPQLTAETRNAIARAASPAQGLALLFASPEFQRR